jgi:ABC-2 type transport system ATP-binding protein
MIEISGLRKRYNSTQALDGFTLRIAEGELCGLVGPNGAGKTTLIKILATLLPFEDGAARVGGLDVARERQAAKRLIGYMPDVPGIYQEMRVHEFLEFFALAFRLRGAACARAVNLALERAGLTGRREEFVESLSLGLKQRLVLARTLLHEPRVLLLDEPATGLDPLARAALREQLKQLAAAGLTILISSHILTDLEDICMRVAFISAGKNAAGPGGESVLTLREAEAPRWVCEIEFVGDAGAAERAARTFAGGDVLEAGADLLRIKMPAGREQAAALLRHLVNQGVSVVRFTPGAPSLEAAYRETFREPKP